MYSILVTYFTYVLKYTQLNVVFYNFCTVNKTPLGEN